MQLFLRAACCTSSASVLTESAFCCVPTKHPHNPQVHSTIRRRGPRGQKAACASSRGYVHELPRLVLGSARARVCVFLLTCESSSWSPPASSATFTEAKGRLAICWRSLISCCRHRNKERGGGGVVQRVRLRKIFD